MSVFTKKMVKVGHCFMMIRPIHQASEWNKMLFCLNTSVSFRSCSRTVDLTLISYCEADVFVAVFVSFSLAMEPYSVCMNQSFRFLDCWLKDRQTDLLTQTMALSFPSAQADVNIIWSPQPGSDLMKCCHYDCLPCHPASPMLWFLVDAKPNRSLWKTMTTDEFLFFQAENNKRCIE